MQMEVIPVLRLYRAKKKNSGEWVIGFYVRAYCSMVRDIILPKDVFADKRDYERVEFDTFDEVSPDTVGQCSMVEDSYGKMMYEGDVVEGLFHFGMAVNAVVEFRNGSFGLKFDRGGVNDFSSFTSLSSSVKLKVVGNMWDNPELLWGMNAHG